MSGKSGNKNQAVTTQSNSSEPWGPTQSHLKNIYGQSGAIASGSSFTPWSGQRYVAPNQAEMNGLSGVVSVAQAGNPLMSGLIDRGQDILNGRGMAQPLTDIANGNYAIQETGLGRDNKDFQDVVNTSVRKGVDEVTGLFSGQGRFGGGQHQGTVMDTSGQIAGGMYADQYNKDADRLTQQRSANIQNRMAASQGLMSGYNNIATLAPSINEMRYYDSRQLVDAGAALRGEQEAKLAADRGYYEEQQAAPRKALEWYNGMLNGGSAGSSSTSTSTTTQPQGSRISGLLGGAATGAAIGSKFGGWGTVAGGGLGALAGLFS